MFSGHEPGESLSLKLTAASPEIAFVLANSVAHLTPHCLKNKNNLHQVSKKIHFKLNKAIVQTKYLQYLLKFYKQPHKSC
jgi:hypothetical protein